MQIFIQISKIYFNFLTVYTVPTLATCLLTLTSYLYQLYSSGPTLATLLLTLTGLPAPFLHIFKLHPCPILKRKAWIHLWVHGKLILFPLIVWKTKWRLSHVAALHCYFSVSGPKKTHINLRENLHILLKYMFWRCNFENLENEKRCTVWVMNEVFTFTIYCYFLFFKL